MVTPVIVLAVWLVFWLVDSAANSDKTPRGLTLESPANADISVDIGGMSRDDVTAVVTELAERFGETPVEITTPSRALTVTAADLGLALDVEATVAVVMGLDSGQGNPFGWTASFFEDSQATPAYTLRMDPGRIGELEQELRRRSTDPTIVLENGLFQVIPGVPGEVADLAAAAPQLLEAANRGENPLTVAADVRLVPPDLADGELHRITGELNRRTGQGLLVTVEEVTKRVQPAQLRTWLTVAAPGRTPSYSIDRGRLEDDLAQLFLEVATVASEPVLTITNDRPVLVSEVPALVCCEDTALDTIATALETEQPDVTLELRESDEINDQSWLQNRGIVELTGRFTTHFQPAQDRVLNIQRIAELHQGVVVYPGETFSVNEHVGERTEEKGFVSAGVIYDGVYDDDVGGGISQFITTLFTATFNAGMEFPEYQAHSIDIPRYRDGVDATISWPKPDFKFRNPHPYAVLLWPTTTDASVTVSVYSTAYAEVEWTDRYDTPRRFCTLRTTERTRTYADGTVLRDSVTALYQPREGLNCDGRCTSSVLPLDADGDGETDLDDEGLPMECVLPEDCIDTHAPVDTNDDLRPDLCTLAPPAPDPDPGDPNPDDEADPNPNPDTDDADDPEDSSDPDTESGTPQALDPASPTQAA